MRWLIMLNTQPPSDARNSCWCAVVIEAACQPAFLPQVDRKVPSYRGLCTLHMSVVHQISKQRTEKLKQTQRECDLILLSGSHYSLLLLKSHIQNVTVNQGLFNKTLQRIHIYCLHTYKWGKCGDAKQNIPIYKNLKLYKSKIILGMFAHRSASYPALHKPTFNHRRSMQSSSSVPRKEPLIDCSFMARSDKMQRKFDRVALQYFYVNSYQTDCSTCQNDCDYQCNPSAWNTI